MLNIGEFNRKKIKNAILPVFLGVFCIVFLSILEIIKFYFNSSQCLIFKRFKTINRSDDQNKIHFIKKTDFYKICSIFGVIGFFKKIIINNAKLNCYNLKIYSYK